MKRALRSALLVLLLSVAGMEKGYAYDFSAVCETGQTLYYNITDATNYYVELTCPGTATYLGCWSGYTRPTGDIVLPEIVQNQNNGVSYTVTSIGDFAFCECSDLRGNLTIPNSVTTIGIDAFERCSGFTGDLTIGNSVTTIGGAAFYYCSGFTGNLTIGNSVTTIGDHAFVDCSGFTGNLSIPNSVTEIGIYAFFECSGFNGSLTIGNSVVTIGKAAFHGCNGFNSSLTIPNSVISIGESAFGFCRGFTGNLTIGNSVTTIGKTAFSECGFTGNLTIPNSVVLIGDVAFWDCHGFTGNLTIGNSVAEIGYRAFSGCSNFSSITVSAIQPPAQVSSGAFQDVPKDIPVYVPCGLVDEYQSAMYWNEFTNYVEALSYHLTAEAIDPEHCSVSIVQQPSCEESLGIVKAEPTEGYMFVAWEEDGTVVSTDVVYSLIVDRDIHLVARIKSNSSISESTDESIAVYPNPTYSKVCIKTKDIKNIGVYNLLGQNLFECKASGNEFIYDFSKYDAGLYLIRIETTNGVVVKKVLVR